MTPDQLAKSGTEAGHQRALFAWANMAEKYGRVVADDNACYIAKGYVQLYIDQDSIYPIPQLKWLHAIHNQGHGDAIRGGNARAEGVKAGVLDIFLPYVARSKFMTGGLYHYSPGLYIEMKKAKTGVISDKQAEFMQDASTQGYKCVVCLSWQEARDEILKYLGLD